MRAASLYLPFDLQVIACTFSGERKLQRYIIIRLFHGVIAFIGVTVVVFSLVRLTGDPLDALLGEEDDEETAAYVSELWGLDDLGRDLEDLANAMNMNNAKKYSREMRERAVGVVFDHEREYNSQWAARRSNAELRDVGASEWQQTSATQH